MRIVAIDWLLAKGRGPGAALQQAAADQRVMRSVNGRSIGRSQPGRAWINGRETGGADTRYAHLSGSHD
jgi:hypothetical protein